MGSFALELFDRCIQQVEEVELAAQRAEATGFSSATPILRRSAYVLAVAALDSYFHERGVDLLRAEAGLSCAGATKVANYLQNVSAAALNGSTADAYIRLRLSFKTLVSPTAIDRLLIASGHDAETRWLEAALALGSRPDRLRRLLDLVYDRRNLIAHEADWNMVQLDFRVMEATHLNECVMNVGDIARAFDPLLSVTV